MRKFIVLASFLISAPIIFFLTLYFYLYTAFQTNPQEMGGLLFEQSHTVSYAALPTLDVDLSADIVPADARVEMIRQFMARYNSPLEEHASLIVATAEKYDLDYRLLPAIAMQESGLCRRIPHNSHNCWGFGIYGDKVTRFKDYPEAIEQVSRTLSHKYKDRGLVTAEQIMSMYTPSSNGSWANGVNYFMDQLQ